MEFNEKLSQLRKAKGLTQEELAEALYVSRTAVSKWESGRGYPSIDSLKEISNYFSVTIDDLLSGEKLILLAEKENKTNIKNMCGLMFGILDIFYVVLILLPLYPKTVGGYVFSVSLFNYGETSYFNILVYKIMFALFVALGAAKLLLLYFKVLKGQKMLTAFSILLGVFAALFLSLAREAYAASAAILLLAAKTALVFRCKG